MLNPKTYQTPNALDPGEAPPSRPSHHARRAADDTANSVQALSVEEVRRDAARLLSGDETSSVKSFPYDDNEDDEESGTVHDQLPSVEEARQYAGRILRAKSTRDLSPQAERQRLTGVPIMSSDTLPYQRKARNRCVRALFFTSIVVVLIVAIAAIVVTAKDKTETRFVEAPLPRNGPTNSPTPEVLGGPASERLQSAIEFLTRTGISDSEALATPHSPQYEAATWIADRDGLMYDIPTVVGLDAERFVQRYVLAVFYYSLGGPNWAKQYKFLSNNDECGWFEMETLRSGDVYAIGVDCNPNLEVEDILIPRNRLRGTLPSELSALRSLSFLDLNRNSIIGTIPDAFQALESMIFFDVRYNLVTGTVPEWMGTSMSRLEVLSVSDNLMRGALPASLSNLRRLKTLALDDNNFESTLVPIDSLPKLEFVYLDNNEFRDILGDTKFANMENLTHLDLSGNMLTSDGIPLHLFEHDQLTVLDLHDNDLAGTIPTMLKQNTVLKFLALQDNALGGQIPLEINNLLALSHLDLTGNELVGEIPGTVGDMLSLTYLFLSENPFTRGPIPPALLGLANLRELSLGQTNRVGTIPHWVDQLNKLVLLDFSRNELDGTIPPELWKLSSLNYLLLQRNGLTGDVPPGMMQVPLKMLLLDKNNLQADLSDECNTGLDTQYLVADCAGPNPEVSCSCCTLCCQDSDGQCNDDILYGNVDPKWENNYTRTSYGFSPKVLFDA